MRLFDEHGREVRWTTGRYHCFPSCEPAGKPVGWHYDEDDFPLYACMSCQGKFGVGRVPVGLTPPGLSLCLPNVREQAA